MTGERTATYLQGLVRELCKLPSETEWVEFKVDNTHPQEIGEYISALANASALAGKFIKDAIRTGAIVPFDPDASRQQMKYVPWWAGRGAPARPGSS